MHFISDELRDSYISLRIQFQEAVTWAQRVKICMPNAKLMAPATENEIHDAERSLNLELPTELKGFLRESNGLNAIYSHPVCSVSKIVAMNHEYRTAEHFADRMPFDHLLFFGDTGNGDDFAFPIYRSGEIGSVVFMWEHETDCRQEYANGLSDFLIHYALEFYSLRTE